MTDGSGESGFARMISDPFWQYDRFCCHCIVDIGHQGFTAIRQTTWQHGNETGKIATKVMLMLQDGVIMIWNGNITLNMVTRLENQRAIYGNIATMLMTEISGESQLIFCCRCNGMLRAVVQRASQPMETNQFLPKLRICNFFFFLIYHYIPTT